MRFCSICGFQLKDSVAVCPVCGEKQGEIVQPDRGKRIMRVDSTKIEKQKKISVGKKRKAGAKKKSKMYMLFPVVLTGILIAFLLLQTIGNEAEENVIDKQTVSDEVTAPEYISRITEDALRKKLAYTVPRTNDELDSQAGNEREMLTETDDKNVPTNIHENDNIHDTDNIHESDDIHETDNIHKTDNIHDMDGSSDLTGVKETWEKSDSYDFLLDDLKDERKKWKEEEAEWKAEALERKAEEEALKKETDNDTSEREQLTGDAGDFEDESEQFEASTEARNPGTVSYEQPTEVEASN